MSDLSLSDRIQFEAEMNDFIDRLDALDPRFADDEDERIGALADEHEEMEFGRAVMGA